MKLKDISRTATFAWDQTSSANPLLVTGAVAGALDANFSDDSQLEIWEPDFSGEASLKLGGDGQKGPQGSITVGSRFNRLAWSASNGTHSKGVIAAGMETGEINVYDPVKILGGSDADASRIFRSDKHTGPVRGLDFNPIQKNLLLSGAINAELYIFDLNKPSSAPITPGPTSTKLNEITSLQWNPTVSRVFAASSSSGYTSVWDLKAGKEIVSLQYGGGAAKGGGAGAGAAGLQVGKRRGMSDVCWHPESATRLITASEDDDSPIIMLWDLRNTRAPEKILSGHTKGVLSVAWCKQDSDLLLSCGKDNRTLCWNPQSGEIIGELPSTNDWSFQTTFCPRNPDLLATASFDGHIGIHSLQTTQTVAAPAPAFSETATPEDIFGALGDAEQVDDTSNVVSLKQPPKWLRRPASATFGYGGLLASTSNLPGANGKHQSGVAHLRKITTEPEIIDRAEKLDSAAGKKDELEEFCNGRTGDGGDTAWKALQTLFKANSRDELIQLLGFSKEEVQRQVTEAIKALPGAKADVLDTPVASETAAPEPAEETTTPKAEEPTSAVSEASAPASDVPSGGAELTEENLFDQLAADADADAAGDDSSDFFSTIAAGNLRNPRLDSIVPHKNEVAESSRAATVGSRASSVHAESIKENTFSIYPSGESDVDRLITQALVLGNFASAVDLCLASERYADALLLAVRGGPELLQSTQKAYFAKRTTSTPFLRVFQSIITEDLADIVQNADLGEWKVAFVVLCTFAKDSEFNHLADQLGQRLQYKYRTLNLSDSAEKKTAAKVARQDATLCYLAARRLEKVVSIWSDEMREEEESASATRYTAHALALQSFIEKVAVFTAATGYVDQDLASPTQSTETAEAGARTYRLASLYDRYYEYADLLAAQGLVEIAAKYIRQTPADYKGTGQVTGLDKARDRVLAAAGAAGGIQAAGAFGATSAPAVPAVPAQMSARGAVAGYSQPPQQQQQQRPAAYQPIPSAGPYGVPPPQNASVPSMPPQTAPSAYQPPPSSFQQPPQQQQNYGYDSQYAPQQSYQPPVQQQQQGYQVPSPYAPPNGYGGPAQPSNQGQGYGAPTQQPYGAPPQTQTMPGPPPRSNILNGASASSTPPPIPAAQRRDIPGWNDAPTISAPKRPQSAAAKENKLAPIMSPFPMSDSQSTYGFPQGQGPPQQFSGPTPPPSRGPGAPGMLPPPPKGGPRPPSAQQAVRQAIGLPPQQQQQQQQRSPPQPQQQFQQTPPPPQQQQQQQQQYPAPPTRTPTTGPPPARGQTPRAGPPPPGVITGPPPPRALSPLGPPGRQPQGQGQYAQPSISGQLRPTSAQGQRQQPPTAGPPPPGRAGPPPPGRTGSAMSQPPVQQQQQRVQSPPAPAQPAASTKPIHPAGVRSHIPPGSRPIYETLNSELNRVKSANLPPQLKKIVDDTERRLNILFDALNNDTVAKDVVDKMGQISRAIAARDLNLALAKHVELLTGATSDMAAWAPGVKQLIRLGV